MLQINFIDIGIQTKDANEMYISIPRTSAAFLDRAILWQPCPQVMKTIFLVLFLGAAILSVRRMLMGGENVRNGFCRPSQAAKLHNRIGLSLSRSVVMQSSPIVVQSQLVVNHPLKIRLTLNSYHK